MIRPEIPIKHLLFLDIETAASHANFEDMSEGMQKAWIKKASRISQDTEADPAELYTGRAGIFAEFGKIITISVGFFMNTDNIAALKFKVKAIANHDEKQLLEEFKAVMEGFRKGTGVLVGHNGKEFDFPYICRRMLVNRIDLPEGLQIWGKKPWEVRHLDTMQLWKFGDYKNFTSLDLLAQLFDLPTSKDDIDGSQVNEVYYKEEGGLERIATYCNKDVVLTARLFLRLHNMPVFGDEAVVYV
ncbi:MAG: 3'-5' exonuclease [Bernardetiaceae bacterium]|nr:3'-5' exonuclease [Bernardetiaceae bacterium]